MPFSTRAYAFIAPAMAVACALLFSHAPAALAQTPRDVAAQTERPEVRAVEFKGIKSVEVGDLQESLATQPSSCLSLLFRPVCVFSKSPYFYERRYLDQLEFRRDVLRVLVYYYRRGWRDARVDTTVARDANNDVRITFTVVEGPPTVVDTVVVTGFDSTTRRQRGRRRNAGAPRPTLRRGDPLNLLRLDSTVALLRGNLLDRGRGNATVEAPQIAVDTVTHHASVTIPAHPGPLTPIARIDVVQLRPNHRVSDETILNSLSLKPGELLRRRRIAESQRALYESGLFRSALIDTAVATDAANGRTVCAQQGVGSETRQTRAAVAAGGAVRDSTKNLVVCVLEGQLHDARASVGFNTADFFAVQGQYTDNYWLGGPRRLTLSGAVGNLGAEQLNGNHFFFDVFPKGAEHDSRYFSPTFQVGANVQQRWFRSPRNTLGTGVFGQRRSSPGVFIDRGYGANVAFTRRLTPQIPLTANYQFQINRVDAGDIYFCVNFGVCDFQTIGALQGQQRLSPLALTGSGSTADDPLEPTRGYVARVELEHASVATMSDYRYNRIFAQAATYKQIGFRRSVLAFRVQGGLVRALASTNAAVGAPDGDAILHPSKRFYAGGSQSVRGFGENTLGPRVLTIDPKKLTGAITSGDSTLAPACVASTADQLRACFDARKNLLEDTDFIERPLGGTSIIGGSAEWRVPIFGQFWGAVFVDGAVLGERSLGDFGNSTMAVTPGIGVRYLSPVGPVRVDIGYRPKLNESLTVYSQLNDSAGIGRQLIDLTNGTGCTAQGSAGCRLFPLNQRSGFKGLLDRITLHLSIGEAF